MHIGFNTRPIEKGYYTLKCLFILTAAVGIGKRDVHLLPFTGSGSICDVLQA